MPDPSIAEQIAELIRESNVRRRVYPAWITRGKLSGQDADLRLKRLDAAIKTLQQLDKQPDLFDEH